MKVNSLIRNCFFARRCFIRWLFGVDVVASPVVQSYCEWGTLALRYTMAHYIWPGARILDLGTGAHALLAIFAKKRFPQVSVVATDILPERICFARETVAHNKVEVDCLVADMFDGIEDKFDLILFNPPAIPSSELAELGYKLKPYPGLGARRCWSGDGGPDGLAVIRVFLNEVGKHLTIRGRAIVSINPIHCGRARFGSLCRMANLMIAQIHRFPGIVNAYVLINT